MLYNSIVVTAINGEYMGNVRLIYIFHEMANVVVMLSFKMKLIWPGGDL